MKRLIIFLITTTIFITACRRIVRVEVPVPVVLPTPCVVDPPPDPPGPIFHGCTEPWSVCMEKHGAASLIAYLAAARRWMETVAARCGTVDVDAQAPEALSDAGVNNE